MKKTMILLLAAASLAACTKTETEAPDIAPVPDYSAPIALSAGIDITADSKAPVTGTVFPANTTNVFRLTAYAGSGAPTNWTTAYFADQQVNSGASSAISLATAQYYPANGDKLYFYAYAPAATSVTAGTSSAAPIANYTIDGSKDIMAAQVTSGIAKAATGTQTQPALAFTHKLKQVSFKVIADASFETGVKVTSIQIKEAKTSAKLAVNTGNLTFDATTGTLTAYSNATGTTIGTTLSGVIGSPVMFEPGTKFKVGVVAGGVTYTDVEVTLSGTNAGNAGVSHVVTLTFKRNQIVPTAGITDWTKGTDAGVDIK